MLVTPDGIIIEVKADAPMNALDPMMVTLDGIVIDVNFDAYMNALEPMLVNLEPSANVTEVMFDA